jgi:hypothetical protein
MSAQVKNCYSFIRGDVEILMRSPDFISNNCYCSKKKRRRLPFSAKSIEKAADTIHRVNSQKYMIQII